MCFEPLARASDATEEVPEAEEDLEDLNEEEIKKMQSDEVWILLSCVFSIGRPCSGLF